MAEFEVGQRVKVTEAFYSKEGVRKGQFGFVTKVYDLDGHYDVKAEVVNDPTCDVTEWPFSDDELEAA